MKLGITLYLLLISLEKAAEGKNLIYLYLQVLLQLPLKTFVNSTGWITQMNGFIGSSEIVRIALYAKEKAIVKCDIHNFVQWRYMPAPNIIVEGNILVFKPAYVYNGGAYICQGYKENSTVLHDVTFHIYVGGNTDSSFINKSMYLPFKSIPFQSCYSLHYLL